MQLWWDLKILHYSLFTLMALASLSGCNNYLVFTTATKFGLEVYQDAGQPPKVLMGYKRSETAIIPATHTNADETKDTYSVLGDFCVHADPSLRAWWDGITGGSDTTDSLQIRSLFVTGYAAQKAASDTAIQNYFAKAVKERSNSGSSEKHCF
ncbi:MAG TPA: hypothetical protein DDY39_17550 [Nitrospira sp.]|nr:hypothetical protein [Nitrospira sp.]HBR48604.1 hypothetical protein [Nitrospira sp.]